MDAAIELNPDDLALLRMAASAPVCCDSGTIRQRCINLEARALLQRMEGRSSVFGRPTFLLTSKGWRRLSEAARLARRLQPSR